MEADPNGSSEYQELTTIQKINALHKLFEHAPTENDLDAKPRIPVEIIHPEKYVGMWLGKEIPDLNFPPQHGQIIRFLYQSRGRKSPAGVLVDLSRGDRFFSSMTYLGFNMDAVLIRKDGSVVLDCSRLKGFQTPMPV